MKLCLLQQDIVYNSPSANRQSAASALSANPGCDLYVLPELWTTGFLTDPAEQTGMLTAEYQATVDWMSEASRLSGGVVCGSVCAVEGGKGRNRFVAAWPDGRLLLSDKRHLFHLGGEAIAYERGERRDIFEVAGLRFLPLICYDLRFPVWSRCRGEEYDALLYVADWPATRIAAWDVLLRARAIENQAFAVGVNRVGRQGVIDYPGHSLVIGPRGETVAEALTLGPEAVVADIGPEPVQKWRARFPALADEDAFQIDAQYANP